MKIKNDSTCQNCRTDEESAVHVVAECESYKNLRHQIFGKFTLAQNELKTIDFKKLLEFLRKARRFEVDSENL